MSALFLIIAFWVISILINELVERKQEKTGFRCVTYCNAHHAYIISEKRKEPPQNAIRNLLVSLTILWQFHIFE